MSFFRKKIYATAGFNTVSLGTGRKEFHPKKPRPGIEHYIKEAGLGSINQIQNPENIDEGVIGNFMAARFCKQGNLGGCVSALSTGPAHFGDAKLEVWLYRH